MDRFRHSPFATRPSRGASVAHRFEVWSVLESHAAYRLALADERDLQLPRQLVADCDTFHRACSAQNGNQVLAAMTERAQREACGMLARNWPAADELQRQHLEILDLLQRREPERTRDAVRAHIQFLRDLSLPTLSGARR